MDEKALQTVGVVGHTGMVGKTVYDYFRTVKSYEVFGYSRSNPEQKIQVNNADVVFVCVPTPFNWEKSEFDGSIVEQAISEVADGKIVIIKSTVPVGFTDSMQEKFPNLKILFNPEFLSEATAYGDFINPDRQFVGHTKQSFGVAMTILNMLPESPYGIIVPAQEAEFLKYVNNLHGTLAVIEANHYYDVCQKLGMDYERVIKASHASKWIGVPMGRQYHKIFHKGYRGFGGKCFPKDINAYLNWCADNDIESDLFSVVQTINRQLLETQGLTEKQAESK